MATRKQYLVAFLLRAYVKMFRPKIYKSLDLSLFSEYHDWEDDMKYKDTRGHKELDKFEEFDEEEECQDKKKQ